MSDSLPIAIPGYEVISFLGEGGMGSVYKARQVSLNRIVALKVLHPPENDPEVVPRFLREARAAARLNHGNIVVVNDVGQAGGVYYLAMELVEGESCQAILRREGRLEERRALIIARQVAFALQHAFEHRVVHRDVKPGNILVARDGAAKLCDFGLARPMEHGCTLTQGGICLGTPWYMAPEQGDQCLDIRADIYSLGATLYHLLTGSPPFDGPGKFAVLMKHVLEPVRPPRELRPDLSEAAENIVLRAMEKEPDQRYQTPAQMAEDLARALQGQAVPRAGTPPAPPRQGEAVARRVVPPRTGRAVPRRRWPLVVLTAAGVAALTFAAGPLWTRHRGASTVVRGPEPRPTAETLEQPLSAQTGETAPSTTPEEEGARAALDAAEECRRDAGDDPKKAIVVIKLYQVVLDREEFRLTRARIEATHELEQYRAKTERMAAAALQPIREEADRLSRDGRYVDAAKAYDAFPAELAFTDTWEKAAAEVTALQGKDRERCEKVDSALKNASELASSHRYADARLALEAVKGSCDAAQLARVDALLVQYTEEERQHDSDAEAKRKNAGVAAYRLLRKTLHGALHARKFDEARAELDKAGRDPDLATRLDALKQDLQEVGLLEGAYADAEAAARKLAERQQTVVLSRFEQPASVSVEAGRVVFHTGGASFPLNFDLLPTADAVTLVKRGSDVRQPVTQLVIGLLWFHACDLEKPGTLTSDEFKQARAALDAARKKDARAERYFDWLEDAADTTASDAARDLLGKAKASAERKAWAEAYSALQTLLMTYGDLPYVRDHKAEIDGLVKSAEDRLEGGVAAMERHLAVKPAQLSRHGWIDITYDWSDAAQLADWEPWAFQVLGTKPSGDWGVKDGELWGRGHKYLYWRPKLVGDVRISFTMMPQVTHNLGVQFCDDHQGKCYRAALGYADSGLLSVLAKGLHAPPVNLLRLDLAGIADMNGVQTTRADWEKYLKVIEGRQEPDLCVTSKYDVALARYEDELELTVNGKSVFGRIHDKSYSGGQFALWCDEDPTEQGGVSARWGAVHIKGVLDPEWIDSCGK